MEVAIGLTVFILLSMWSRNYPKIAFGNGKQSEGFLWLKKIMVLRVICLYYSCHNLSFLSSHIVNAQIQFPVCIASPRMR